LSENNSESLKPDTEEKVAELQEKLAATDRLISRKNQEIADLNARLIVATQKISERDEEIEQLESELASRPEEISTSSAPIAISVDFPEPADLLNQLKGKRKKSKAELADIAAILEVLQADTD
jgi:chromosome segregation ATPase